MPAVPVVFDRLQDLTDVSFASIARGNVLYRGASTWNNLAPGTSGQVLTTGGAGADPSWATVSAGATTLDGLTDVNLPSASQGDLLYRNATEWVRLAAGTSGHVLTTGGAGANPAWAAGSSDLTNAVILAPTASARNVIQGTGVGVTGLGVKAVASQTANRFELQDADGHPRWVMDNGGASYQASWRLNGTADQTTNFARMVIGNYLSGGVHTFSIEAIRGGTVTQAQAAIQIMAGSSGSFGSGTGVNIDAANGRFFYLTDSASFQWLFTANKQVRWFPNPTTANMGSAGALEIRAFSGWTGPNDSNTQRFFRVGATWQPTASTGKYIHCALEPILNQTGTATGDYTALYISPTETAATGTNKRLIEATVGGGSARFEVFNTGFTAARVTDAATNSVSDALTLSHNTSGTPAAGFGSQICLQLESSTTENRDAAGIGWTWATATDASRKGRLTLSVVDASATREGLRFDTDGSLVAVSSTAAWTLTSPAAASLPLLVIGAGSQSGALIECRKSDATMLFQVLPESAGSYGVALALRAGSQILEQTAAIGGTERLIIRANGDRLDLNNEAGTNSFMIFDGVEAYLRLNSATSYYTFTATAFTLNDGINLAVGTTNGTKLGTATNQKLGFFNATPVVQQTVDAAATDPASTQALANSLRQALLNLGLAA
jgi:hypothetical protein